QFAVGDAVLGASCQHLGNRAVPRRPFHQGYLITDLFVKSLRQRRVVTRKLELRMPAQLDGNLLLGMGRKSALQSQKHYTDDPSEKCPLAPPAVAVAATFHHPNPSSETSLK